MAHYAYENEDYADNSILTTNNNCLIPRIGS